MTVQWPRSPFSLVKRTLGTLVVALSRYQLNVASLPISSSPVIGPPDQRITPSKSVICFWSVENAYEKPVQNHILNPATFFQSFSIQLRCFNVERNLRFKEKERKDCYRCIQFLVSTLRYTPLTLLKYILFKKLKDRNNAKALIL